MDAWNILVVVVLALILLLILPMVAARNGTKSFTQALMAPLHRNKQRGPSTIRWCTPAPFRKAAS